MHALPQSASRTGTTGTRPRVRPLVVIALTSLLLVSSACSGSEADDLPENGGEQQANPEGGTGSTSEPTLTTTAPTGDAQSGDDASRPTESPTAPRTPPEEISLDEEQPELVASAVEVQSEVLARPDSYEESSVAEVAEGNAYEEIVAAAQEFIDNGWTQEGAPLVISSTVLEADVDTAPPTVVLEVCLDHSAVEILDDSGDSVVDPDAPMRVLNHFTMHFADDRWVLSNRSFPIETDC